MDKLMGMAAPEGPEVPPTSDEEEEEETPKGKNKNLTPGQQDCCWMLLLQG